MGTMKNGDLGQPNAYDYSSDFSYAVWTPGSYVTLANVPWSADYRDVVDFKDTYRLNLYLNESSGPTITVNQVSYIRAGQPVRLSVPFNDAYRFNYLRVTNPAQPVGETGGGAGESFYYFILDVKHVAPNTTEFIVQLDVWSTFRHKVEFRNTFVQRGHIGIADTNFMYKNGRYLAIQPEGLDTGNEYAVRRVYRKSYGDTQAGNYDVIVYSTVELEGDWGTVENPNLTTSSGSNWEGLPNGATAYWFESAEKFVTFMMNASNYPWITQGIISIQAIPSGIVAADDRTAVKFGTDAFDGGIAGYRLHGYSNTNRGVYPAVTLGADWIDTLTTELLGTRYRNLKKFFTSPYTVLEVTTFNGTPIILKPECLGSDANSGVKLNVLAHFSQPAPRMMFVPADYNADGTRTYQYGDDAGESLDFATGFFNFPTFSLTNNSYISFMASNAHSIAFQHSSADWSQQKALTANQLGYDQASAGMALNSTMNTIGNAQAIQSTQISKDAMVAKTAFSAVTDIAGGFSHGGAGGLVAGAASAGASAVNTGIDMHTMNAQTALGVNSNNARLAASQSTAGYYRDSNKDYADFAAKGDYANAIGAINAKTQDAKLTQPTTSGQLGGDAFNLSTVGFLLSLRVKTISGAALHSIGEYWLRYGYAINRFYDMNNELSVMEKFTYWQVKEMYLVSSKCPESFKNTLRGIFEKGVTVWRNPADIGQVDIADNDPTYGVRLRVNTA